MAARTRFSVRLAGRRAARQKYAGEPTRLEIGDNNTIREFCTFNVGTVQDGGLTRLGNDNWVMACVHIAHDCIVGDHCILANNATLAGHISIGDHVFRRADRRASVLHHRRHAMTAGGSIVVQDIPPYVTAAGNHAHPAGINSEGLRRRGFDAEQISRIKRAYKQIYRQGLSLEDAKAAITEAAADAPELALFVDFFHPLMGLFPPDAGLRIAMVAGEASGDMLGARLIDAIRARRPDALCRHRRPQNAGRRAGKPVSARNPGRARVMWKCCAICAPSSPSAASSRLLLAERPDVFIGVDAPDFNLAVEHSLKAAGIRTIHYVSPSIWAWRGERVHKIKQAVNRVLALFPMEPPIYQAAGVPVSYVGHPLAESMPIVPDRQGA